jgi:competence protein ComGC
MLYFTIIYYYIFFLLIVINLILILPSVLNKNIQIYKKRSILIVKIDLIEGNQNG